MAVVFAAAGRHSPVLRAAKTWLCAGVMIILVACGGRRTPYLTQLPSPEVFATASPPVLLPSPLPTSSPTPLFPFPVPSEYANIFHLAGEVYGVERLIQRVRIPAVGVDSPVVPVGWRTDVGGAIAWDSPGQYVGWAVTSSLPDEDGNVVLYGHNNIEGSVFRHLYRLQPGDVIVLITGQGEWRYQVEEVLILAIQEANAEKQAYQAYLQSTRAPRLTVISCYPPDDNTHRILVMAKPTGLQADDSER